MNTLWKIINKKAWADSRKNHVFLGCSVLFFSFVAFVLWGMLFRCLLPDISWLICFMGYGGIFGGYIGGILFLYSR